MEHSNTRFEDIPSEVHAKIFDYLTTKELLRTIARASKDYARLLEDALLVSGAAPNSSNILVTGMNGAGCTTLTTRIKEALGVDNTLRMTASSDEIRSVRINDNSVNVFGVQLKSCMANVWHGSTRQKQRKMMFHYYGVSQLVVFVVPSQVTASNKQDLKEALLALYSLAGHTNWIVVVNKMDLMQYSEQEYNNTVATVQKYARKIMGQHVDQLTFVPVTSTGSSQHCIAASANVNMPWYSGPTLLSELNSRAVQFQVPAVKLVKKLNMSVIAVYNKLSQVYVDPKDSTVVLSVYVMDGLLRVGGTVELYPPCSAKPSRNYMPKGVYPYVGHAKVLEIQYLAMSKQYALPNSHVGLKVQFPTPLFRPRYHHLQNLIEGTVALKPNTEFMYRQYQGLFSATLVHIANKSKFNRKWDGVVKQGYSGGFATVSLRGLMTVERILKIFDKDGNELDLNELKTKRGSVGLERGEKAQVIVRVWCPMPLVFKEPVQSYNFPDSYGRVIIYHDQSRLVLVGVLHGAYTKLPLYAQEYINNEAYLNCLQLKVE